MRPSAWHVVMHPLMWIVLLMHCISVGIFVYVSHVSADAEMTGTRLSDGMQSVFLFFTAPRSESVWDSYDWICVAWYMPFHRIKVTDFLL